MFYSNGAYSLFKVDTPVISGGATPPSFQDIYSYEFDGVDDYADGSTTYSELNGTTKATFSMWVKPTLGSTFVLSRVSSSTSSTGFVYQLVVIASGEVLMQIGATTRRARTGSTVLTDSVWNHILVCYDGTLSNGSKTKIFINGVDATDSDGTTATSLVNANYPLSIGRRDQTPTYYYDGLIDEIAIWSATDLRTQADVDTIYNSGIPNNLNDNGLTAPTTWYRMGESASWDGSNWTLTDQGSGGNNATTENMAEASRVLDVPPNPFANTKSILLDGIDDYVNCGNTSLLNGGTELTMSGWFKTTDKTLTQVLFSTFAGKTYAEMSLISGGLYCWLGNGVTTSNYNIVNAANLGISNDTWFHLTMVFDGSQSTDGTRLKVYKNGTLLTWSTIRTIPTSFGTSTATTYIGARNTASVFSGNIDEVAFWHSLPSVNNIYTGTTATDLSTYNPISWWRCGDSDTSPILTDNGSGGNDGTMANFTTFSTDVPT